MMSTSGFDVVQVEDGASCFAARSRRTMSRCLDLEPLDQQSSRLISRWRQGARHPGGRSLDRPVRPRRLHHGAPDAPRDQGASRARCAAGPPLSPLSRTTRTPATKSSIRLSASSGNAHIGMFWSQHSPVAPSVEAARNQQRSACAWPCMTTPGQIFAGLQSALKTTSEHAEQRISMRLRNALLSAKRVRRGRTPDLPALIVVGRVYSSAGASHRVQGYAGRMGARSGGRWRVDSSRSMRCDVSRCDRGSGFASALQ
jgi:hypothetical protein